MKKRGQSGVITVVLIILLVLAAIVILWNVVKKTVEKSSGEITIEKLAYKGQINSVTVSASDANVNIERKTGGKEITGIKLIFTDNSGINYIYENKTLFPEELQTINYKVIPSEFGLNNFSNIKEVSLYYIYEQNGVEKLV